MAFSEESGAQSAVTLGSGLRAYDGGTFTLTPGIGKLTVAVAESAPNPSNYGQDGIYRAKIATSEQGPWTVAKTVETPRVQGPGTYSAVSFDITGLANVTTYYVTLALDNNT